MAILSDEVDLMMRDVKKEKEGHFIIIKESIYHIKIIDIFVNNRTSKYSKQKLTERNGEIAKRTTIVGNFNFHLSKILTRSRQKISKKREELNIPIKYTLIL